MLHHIIGNDIAPIPYICCPILPPMKTECFHNQTQVMKQCSTTDCDAKSHVVRMNVLCHKCCWGEMRAVVVLRMQICNYMKYADEIERRLHHK